MVELQMHIPMPAWLLFSVKFFGSWDLPRFIIYKCLVLFTMVETYLCNNIKSIKIYWAKGKAGIRFRNKNAYCIRLLDKSHMNFCASKAERQIRFQGHCPYPYPLLPFPLKNKPLLAHSPEAACLQILVPIWIFIIRDRSKGISTSKATESWYSLLLYARCWQHYYPTVAWR